MQSLHIVARTIPASSNMFKKELRLGIRVGIIGQLAIDCSAADWVLPAPAEQLDVHEFAAAIWAQAFVSLSHRAPNSITAMRYRTAVGAGLHGSSMRRGIGLAAAAADRRVVHAACSRRSRP